MYKSSLILILEHPFHFKRGSFCAVLLSSPLSFKQFEKSLESDELTREPSVRIQPPTETNKTSHMQQGEELRSSKWIIAAFPVVRLSAQRRAVEANRCHWLLWCVASTKAPQV